MTAHRRAWFVLAGLAIAACGETGSEVPSAMEASTVTDPRGSAAVSSAAPAEPDFIPGFPRFPGDTDPACRRLALDTWNPGMKIAGAQPIGEPPSGCEVAYSFFDGTPGYRVAQRWAASADPAWIYHPTGRAEERVEVLDTRSTLWVDDLGPTEADDTLHQAVLLRPDGALYVVLEEGQPFAPVDELARGIDRAATNGFARGAPIPEPLDARPLAVAFGSPVIDQPHVEPPPPGLQPNLTPTQVAQAAQLVVMSDWSEPGTQLLLRFGLYHPVSTTGAETGETVPAWLVIIDGTVWMPSCPPLPADVTTTAPRCGPVTGYSVDVLSDADGSLLWGERLSGGSPPAT